MSKKQRSVLLSVMTLVLCLALVAGGSYALFTDEETLENHLVAGTMDVTLVRTDLVTETLDNSTGFLVEKSVERGDYADNVDYTNGKNRETNVFGLADGDLIVPKSKYTATMTISNNTPEYKSDVAFAYWIKISIGDEDAAKALASQLRVTVKQGSTYNESLLLNAATGDGCYIGGQDSPIGILARNCSQDFTVTVEFVSSDANNSAKSQSLDFDLTVYAVQVTSNPNP